ncbi:MAG TPA: type II toxin-antitoxin system HicA family toxin [Thermoanaerobaculia bacterium]|nr:type II toxin-antitoxin system HicA family toxin [Thermoanaerobaculia bacterium]
MKRRDLERHLRQHGCTVLREGGNHTVFVNETSSRVTAVPRHNEIKTPTVREICKRLTSQHRPDASRCRRQSPRGPRVPGPRHAWPAPDWRR